MSAPSRRRAISTSCAPCSVTSNSTSSASPTAPTSARPTPSCSRTGSGGWCSTVPWTRSSPARLSTRARPWASSAPSRPSSTTACAGRGARCRTGGHRHLAAIERLLDDIDRQPLDAERGRPLTQGLAMLGLALGLYDTGFWSGLRQGLDEATAGRRLDPLGVRRPLREPGPERALPGQLDGGAVRRELPGPGRGERHRRAALDGRRGGEGGADLRCLPGVELAAVRVLAGARDVGAARRTGRRGAADRGRRDHPRPGDAVRVGGGTRRPAGRRAGC